MIKIYTQWTNSLLKKCSQEFPAKIRLGLVVVLSYFVVGCCEVTPTPTTITVCNTPTVITGPICSENNNDWVRPWASGKDLIAAQNTLNAKIKKDVESDALDCLNEAIDLVSCPANCTTVQRVGTIGYNTAINITASPPKVPGYVYTLTGSGTSSASQQVQCFGAGITSGGGTTGTTGTTVTPVPQYTVSLSGPSSVPTTPASRFTATLVPNAGVTGLKLSGVTVTFIIYNGSDGARTSSILDAAMSSSGVLQNVLVGSITGTTNTNGVAVARVLSGGVDGDDELGAKVGGVAEVKTPYETLPSP